MEDPARRGDPPQGTLELLILKTLSREANHGFGITLHVHTVSDGLLRVEEGVEPEIELEIGTHPGPPPVHIAH